MALQPFVEIDAEETVMSWATRLAAVHTGEQLVPFLNDIGLPLSEILKGTNEALARLCEVTGAEFSLLRRNAIHSVEWRKYDLRGEAFSAEFTRGETTGFCPACLIEDDASGVAAANRKGRLLWLVRAVRTCPRHSLPLVERRFSHWLDRSQQMALRVPERGGDLRRLADGKLRPVSALQSYITRRLEGGSGPAWLDGQGIEQVVRAAEMLGVALEFGRGVNLGEFSPDDWEKAAVTGFPLVALGPEGVREALSEIQRRAWHDEKVSAGSGPQMIFGRLYQWLSFNRSAKDEGPIRDVVREHILETMEVSPGAVIFGEKILVRRLHSLPSLAKETGLHRHTVAKLLVRRGLIPHDADLHAHAVIPAADGLRVAEEMKDAITQSDLPRVLNTTRGQVEQLIDCGLIRVVDPDRAGATRLSSSIAANEVRRFLSDLARDAVEVAEAPLGFLGIPAAAMKSRATTETIVRLILAGRLSGVVRVSGIEGYAAIHVDPAEIAAICAPKPEDIVLTVHLAGKVLGLSHATVNAVTRDGNGGVRLMTEPLGPNGAPRIRPEEVNRFRETFVTLFALSREVGMHHLRLSKSLAGAGVTPAGEPSEYAATIYRRTDIPLQFWIDTV